MEHIQKIGLAIIPVVFYFYPHFLFRYLYKRYVYKAFYEIRAQDLDAFNQIQRLKKEISHIVDFVSFLTIAVITPIAVFYDKEKSVFIYQLPYGLSLTIVFVLLAVLSAYNNLTKQFHLGWLDRVVEKGTVIFSAILIYFYA